MLSFALVLSQHILFISVSFSDLFLTFLIILNQISWTVLLSTSSHLFNLYSPRSFIESQATLAPLHIWFLLGNSKHEFFISVSSTVYLNLKCILSSFFFASLFTSFEWCTKKLFLIILTIKWDILASNNFTFKYKDR